MSDLNIDFCRAFLRECRADAKKAGVKIPRLKTHRLSGFTNPHYEVWGPDKLLWQGNASNAYEAKANCIEKLLADAEKVLDKTTAV